ncbi:MAG: DNA-processing protein DprA [Patescibacteria group bacterium]|jgi:DNA processing protein
MVISSQDLPPLLREIPHPPHLLYSIGDAATLYQPAIAIVGSRAMTPYGAAVCEQITAACVRAGLVIVSGLATGIDAVAHQTALQHHGQTIAVLGSGLNDSVMFPSAHRQLADRIISNHGLLLSEYTEKTVAKRHHFIARNRLLAGLCLATVVIEAAERSGAINTAHHALESNRLVFAVPGSIFSSRSIGTHNLIKQGAILVNTPADILSELNYVSPATHPNLTNISTLQNTILQHLSGGAIHLELLAQQVDCDIATLQQNLTDLEIKGIVRKNLWSMYEISHS